MSLFARHSYDYAHIWVWKIEEEESFFTQELGFSAPINNDIKRIEHLSGRFLLKKAYPRINFEHIRISDTRKPILHCQSTHFSISHSYPYVACAIHESSSIGVDIQVYRDKILLIQHKLLNPLEIEKFEINIKTCTMIWCIKEAIYKSININGLEFKNDFIVEEIRPTSILNTYEVRATAFPHTTEQREILLMCHSYEDAIIAYTLPKD